MEVCGESGAVVRVIAGASARHNDGPFFCDADRYF
jgi:hypothetical protein